MPCPSPLKSQCGRALSAHPLTLTVLPSTGFGGHTIGRRNRQGRIRDVLSNPIHEFEIVIHQPQVGSRQPQPRPKGLGVGVGESLIPRLPRQPALSTHRAFINRHAGDLGRGEHEPDDRPHVLLQLGRTPPPCLDPSHQGILGFSSSLVKETSTLGNPSRVAQQTDIRCLVHPFLLLIARELRRRCLRGARDYRPHCVPPISTPGSQTTLTWSSRLHPNSNFLLPTRLCPRRGSRKVTKCRLTVTGITA